MITEHILGNGLKILLEENHSAPVASVNLCYRVGSKHERAGITGISHLLEHLMFKGTALHPKGEFDRLLTEAGADNNAYTWLDRTVYHAVISADKIELALELEADRMRGLLLAPEEHADEIAVVRNELEQRDDSPFSLLYDMVQSAAFKVHPYRIPTIGWLEDIEKMQVEDVRSHYDAYYQPDNAFLVAVGDFCAEEMLAKVDKHFGSIPHSASRPPELPAEPPQLEQRRVTIQRAWNNDYIILAWHTPTGAHPDAYALEVLANALGSGMTCRLYQRLVDTGKASGASASSGCFELAEPFLFTTEVSLNEGTSLTEAEAALWQEIRRIAADGISERELARAKKQARVAFTYRKDSVEAEADLIVSFESAGSYRNIVRFLPALEAVTVSDVAMAARKHLTKHNSTVGHFAGIRGDSAKAGGGVLSDVAHRNRKCRLGVMTSPHPGGAEGVSAVTLENGLRLVIKESHHNSTVTIAGRMSYGSIDDPPGIGGVAGMSTFLLTEGTKLHGKLQLAGMLEDDGMGLAFTSGREQSGFMGKCLAEDFSKLLEILAEELRQPAFSPNQVELVRTQVLNEIRRAKDDTYERAYNHARLELYGEGNPYACRPSGNEESVAAINPEDISHFHNKHARPNRMLISVVGDVKASEAMKLVERLFGDWHAGEAADCSRYELSHRTLRLGNNHAAIEVPGRANATVLFMRKGIARLDENYYATMVANHIFGGDFISRLNDRLRVQEGLTYGSYSFLSSGFGAGPWALVVQTNPENARMAMEIALEEWRRMHESGASEVELSRAKSYLTGNYAVRLSGISAIASALANAEFFGLGADYVRQYPDIINGLNLKQVNEAFVSYLAPEDYIAVAAGSLSQFWG